jgi:hypothetical protein
VHWKHGGWCLSNQLHVIFGGEKYMTVNRWTRWKCFSLDHLPKLECSYKLFPTQKWYNPRIQNFYNKKTKLLLQTTEGSPSVLETLYTPLLIHSANTNVSTFILSKHYKNHFVRMYLRELYILGHNINKTLIYRRIAILFLNREWNIMFEPV